MGLINNIRDVLFPQRNKPGGLAFIKPFHRNIGCDVLTGRVVRTVRRADGRKWVLDPPQRFVATRSFRYEGRVIAEGSTLTIVALADECLDPLKDVGDDEADESLAYLPPVRNGREIPLVFNAPHEVGPIVWWSSKL